MRTLFNLWPIIILMGAFFVELPIGLVTFYADTQQKVMTLCYDLSIMLWVKLNYIQHTDSKMLA